MQLTGAFRPICTILAIRLLPHWFNMFLSMILIHRHSLEHMHDVAISMPLSPTQLMRVALKLSLVLKETRRLVLWLSPISLSFIRNCVAVHQSLTSADQGRCNVRLWLEDLDAGRRIALAASHHLIRISAVNLLALYYWVSYLIPSANRSQWQQLQPVQSSCFARLSENCFPSDCPGELHSEGRARCAIN